MAGEELLQETVGAEVELLVGLRSANTQSPQDIPRFSVPLLFSMADDSSDDDCDLSGDSIFTCGLRSMELGGKCWECGEQIQSNKELIFHLENHKVSTSCNICQVTFSRTISLVMHLVNAHQKAVLQCCSCQLHCSNLWELNKHKGVHLFNELFNSTLEDISNNSLNCGEGFFGRCCSSSFAVTLDHVHNSNNGLNDSEVTEKKQFTVANYSCTSSVARELEVKSNSGLYDSEDKSTLTSTVAFKHEDLTNDCLNGSERIVKRELSSLSAVAHDHDYISKNGTNCSEETIYGHYWLSSTVGHDHTYSLKSNGIKTKSRPWQEEFEEEEQMQDIKPLNVRVKVESGLEIDGAPIQWNEWMKEEESGERSEIIKVVEGEDDDRLTGAGVKMENDNSRQCEERSPKTVCAEKMDVLNGREQDKDAEMSNDEDSDSSGFERESEFDPGELTDSVSEESSMSSYSPVRTRSATMQPPVHGKDSTMCAVCGRGPFVNIDSHFNSCSGNWLFKCSECKIQLPSEKCLVDHNVRYHSAPSKPFNGFCVFCRDGPFTSLDLHKRICSKQKGSHCSVCKVFFPTELVLEEHMLRAHGTPNQVQSTNSETSNGERAGVHCARGPFTGLDVHLGVGSKKLIQCSLCKFFFPGDVLANHMISRHSTKSRVPSPVGENPDPDTRIGCSGTEPFSNLDSHMKTCCQTNCIRCSICKFFFSADVLADHMISYHGTEIQSPETECPQKSVCVNCGKGPFHSLEHHMRYCNKQNGIRCSMCETCFATEGRLLNHIVSAHADKPVTRPTLTSVPTAISTTSGQQSPGSATLTYYSSEVKELKQLTPVVSQGPSVVGPLPHTKLSAVSLPRVMLSTTSSSPSFPSSTVPVMATLVMNNSPGEMPRLVPMVTLPRLQFIDTTQTQRAKPSWQILNSVQQKQTIQPTVPVTHHTSSPITPSPKPGTAAEQVTVIRLFPALPQTQSVVLPPAPAPLSIMYMFVNISRKLALEKRMKMSWRSKGAYTCRQCGAVSRQPSLAVRHRYLHRGLRRYRCHCGRSFLRRMHLLRHYFLHAQATRYICTSCGQTFDGVRGLTQHLTVAADAAKCPGNRGTLQPRQECRMAFTCHCGQVFCRPAAFLWHKLKSTQRV